MERNNKVRRKVKALIYLLIITAFVGVSVLFIPFHRKIIPELITTFPLGYDYRNSNSTLIKKNKIRIWFPVSEKPYTEADEESLKEYIGDNYELDFDKYSYAISFGYKIDRIIKKEYLLSEKAMKGKYKYGEAIAYLSSDCSGELIYFYRMPKEWMDIRYYQQFNGNYIIVE